MTLSCMDAFDKLFHVVNDEWSVDDEVVLMLLLWEENAAVNGEIRETSEYRADSL